LEIDLGIEAVISNSISMAELPSELLSIPANEDAFNIRPVRLTHVFNFLGVFAPGDLRGVWEAKPPLRFSPALFELRIS
jgi:hypothetical protein